MSEHLPAVEFLGFIASLAAGAAAALQQAETADSSETPPGPTSLAQARQLIDTLIVLQEKTTGNLTADESRFLGSAIDDLRLSYVRVSDKAGRSE